LRKAIQEYEKPEVIREEYAAHKAFIRIQNASPADDWAWRTGRFGGGPALTPKRARVSYLLGTLFGIRAERIGVEPCSFWSESSESGVQKVGCVEQEAEGSWDSWGGSGAELGSSFERPAASMPPNSESDSKSGWSPGRAFLWRIGLGQVQVHSRRQISSGARPYGGLPVPWANRRGVWLRVSKG
jgi:hypothetical protein